MQTNTKLNVLGIETSSMVCSVGLVRDGGATVERRLVDPHIHSEKLLTLVEEVVDESGLDLHTLDAVAVSIGPGSFTGLRIGLSTAKGLCYSLGVSLLTVPTFDAVLRAAGRLRLDSDLLHIAVDAKQGEFYYGSFRNNGLAGATVNVQIMRLEELPWTQLRGESSVWITDRPEILRGFGVVSQSVHEYTSLCRGDVVAQAGIDRYRQNDQADLASVEPYYLKEFLVKSAKS
ncbi:MAG TPA: tRNA (adenosine(37)-N6)-threonylcarbamoyltransferase complex dimerization subunit type 1 TsaB [Bacteroidota bacterium]